LRCLFFIGGLLSFAITGRYSSADSNLPRLLIREAMLAWSVQRRTTKEYVEIVIAKLRRLYDSSHTRPLNGLISLHSGDPDAPPTVSWARRRRRVCGIPELRPTRYINRFALYRIGSNEPERYRGLKSHCPHVLARNWYNRPQNMKGRTGRKRRKGVLSKPDLGLKSHV
jgi:hypothetical protein